jgi:hypothetical protein
MSSERHIGRSAANNHGPSQAPSQGIPDVDQEDRRVAERGPPPPYTEQPLGQVSESNENVGSKATIGPDGRVDIQIDQRSKGLTKLLSRIHLDKPIPIKRPEPPSVEDPPPGLNVVIHVVGSRGTSFVRVRSLLG